jgi:hypothetical protein
MSKCFYGVIIFWHYLACSRLGWSLDSPRHLCSCDTNTLGSPIALGSSIDLTTSLLTNEFGPTAFNVNDGVRCLYFGNYVSRELKASPNVDINALSKTLILKIKHLFFLFLSKIYNIFLYKNKKVSRFQQGLIIMNLFMNTYYPL